jgi:hypothetical protein
MILSADFNFYCNQSTQNNHRMKTIQYIFTFLIASQLTNSIETMKRHLEPDQYQHNFNSINNQALVHPLIKATTENKLETVQKLIIFMNKKDMHEKAPTALLIASHKGYDDIVQTLLAIGINANTTNMQGTSALMMACQSGSINTIQTLLNNNADMCKRDAYGKNALTIAQEIGNGEVEELLLEHAAVSAMLTLRQQTRQQEIHSANQNKHIASVKQNQPEPKKRTTTKNKSFYCSFTGCNKVYTNKRSLTRHIRDKHPNNNA